MITIEKNTTEIACFEVNEHGRLISGNKRFCRMFGFDEAEVQWHYVTDLYRYAKDWNEFKSQQQDSSVARMKNRKGRSFNCSIIRQVFQKENGEVYYRNTIHRVGEDAPAVRTEQTAPVSVVYLAKCSHCGSQVRVSTAGETRLRILCDACAAKAYPEAYHVKDAKAL